MVHALADRRLQILTNSFPIAEHLLHNSRNTITLPGGAIYREQNIILSPSTTTWRGISTRGACS